MTQEALNWFYESAWRQNLLAVLLFGAALMLFSFLLNMVWGRLHAASSMEKRDWDALIVRFLRRPARFLAVFLALAVAMQFAPPWMTAHPLATYGVKVGLILIAAWMLERALTAFFKARQLPFPVTDSTRALLLTVGRILVLTIGTLMALDTMGVSITPILASLGVGSLAVALALQDTLSNFFSGLYLLVDKPIRIGDAIRTEDGTEGLVQKIGWRSTRIRLGSNNIVVIPNSKLASSRLTNFDLPDQETSVVVEASVDHECDLERLERATLEAARRVLSTVEGGVASFEPLVRFSGFDRLQTQFSVILRARSFADAPILKHELIKALHGRYQGEGLILSSPQKVIHLPPPPAASK